MQRIHFKSAKEIDLMRQSGLIAYGAHQEAAKLVRPGISTKEISAVVETYIIDHGATPFFKGVPGKIPFPAAACVSLNDEIIHGIPSDRVLCEGDIVSIDTGCKLQGWCSDTATTYPVGQISDEKMKLLTVTENALRMAIKLLATKNYWSEVLEEMEPFILHEGLSIVDIAEGHGLGKHLWEPPSVPNYLTHTYKKYGDFQLVPGLVIAIEPMVNLGKKQAYIAKDGWTVKTKDGSPSAHFEHSIAITEQGICVLTSGQNGEGWAM